MIRELFIILAMILFASQVQATSIVPANSLPSKEYTYKKIEEFDAKLSEYLHIPLKKFSSILIDIADSIYADEVSPLHDEVRQLQQQLADMRNDLKETKNQVRILTTQLETVLEAFKASKDIEKNPSTKEELQYGSIK